MQNGKLYGKLNWRITEPDGEFFTRCVAVVVCVLACLVYVIRESNNDVSPCSL